MKLIRIRPYKITSWLIASVILVVFFSCSDEYVVQPVLNTIQATDADITSTSAILKGNVQIVGNQNIIEYGIQISKNAIFSPYTDKGFTEKPDTGKYEVEFTGLEPGTMYYYKAYAIINTAHVYSQNALHFTTKTK